MICLFTNTIHQQPQNINNTLQYLGYLTRTKSLHNTITPDSIFLAFCTHMSRKTAIVSHYHWLSPLARTIRPAENLGAKNDFSICQLMQINWRVIAQEIANKRISWAFWLLSIHYCLVQKKRSDCFYGRHLDPLSTSYSSMRLNCYYAECRTF